MTSAADEPGRRLRNDPLIVVLSVAAVLIVVGYGADLGGPVIQGIVGWASMATMQVGQVLLCVAIAQVSWLGRGTARFWWTTTVGCAFWALGSGTELVRILLDPHAVSEVSVTHLAAVGAGGFTVVVAMVSFPLGLQDGRERRRFGLDAATVMVGAGIFAWYLAGPSPEAAGRSWTDQALGLLGPALFVVLGFGLLRLLMTRDAPFTRLGAAVGALGAVIEVASTGLDHTLVASGHQSWSMALGMLSNLALVAAFRLQQHELAHGPRQPRQKPPRLFKRLPYIAVVGTYGLLVFEMARHRQSGQVWAILVAATTCTALVMLRQLAVLADNADLLARLDAKVQELAVAQSAMQRALDERDVLACQLRHQAEHDVLTGLANRTLFLREIDAALARARRSSVPIGVLMIDLNDFKPVNDRLGHSAGDAVLREQAARMLSTVREVDVVARLGGDEFAVLVQVASDLNVLIARLRQRLAQPIDADGTEVTVGASIGAVTGDGLDGNGEWLIQRADHLMYAEKQRTKHVVRFGAGFRSSGTEVERD